MVKSQNTLVKSEVCAVLFWTVGLGEEKINGAAMASSHHKTMDLLQGTLIKLRCTSTPENTGVQGSTNLEGSRYALHIQLFCSNTLSCQQTRRQRRMRRRLRTLDKSEHRISPTVTTWLAGSCCFLQPCSNVWWWCGRAWLDQHKQLLVKKKETSKEDF